MDTKSMVSVAIPATLHASLKANADKQGMKLRTFVERILEAALKNQPKGK